MGWLSLRVWDGFRQSLWDGKHNFNFAVVVEDEVYVICWRPDKDKVNILHIPGQTYISLAKGFGEYPASSVWSLGQLEDFGGGTFLQLSMQHFLGVPMQGWGKIKKSKIKNEKLKIEIGKRELIGLTVRLFFTKERSLTYWDLVRLVYRLIGLPKSQINFYSLSETRAGEEVILPDNSKAFRVQKEFLDTLVRELFKDSAFLEEGIIWAVVNKTSYSDLASQVARIINNIGGEVIVVSDVEKGRKKGGVYYQDKEISQSYSARLLTETLKLKLIPGELKESRAEGVLVLDEDYWRFFYSR